LPFFTSYLAYTAQNVVVSHFELKKQVALMELQHKENLVCLEKNKPLVHDYKSNFPHISQSNPLNSSITEILNKKK